MGGKFEEAGTGFPLLVSGACPAVKPPWGVRAPDAYVWPLGVRSTCLPAVPGKTLFEPDPNNWIVPITSASMTTNTTTYSPMSRCSSCRHGVRRNSLILTAWHAVCHGALRGMYKSQPAACIAVLA